MGDEALNEIIKSIIDGDKGTAENATKEALRIGIHPDEIIRSLKKGMDEMCTRTTEFFLPPRYAASAAASLVIDVLRSHFAHAEKRNDASKVVIGTVEGDTHDIGKNLVKVMLEAAGYDVYDLGRNVPKYQYLDKINEVKADICALSATMTPSLYKLRETIDVIVKNETKVKLLAGGLALNPSNAKTFGADAYGKDERGAVKVVTELLGGGLR
jgi:methanogenic corrinoid protein MtbC1